VEPNPLWGGLRDGLRPTVAPPEGCRLSLGNPREIQKIETRLALFHILQKLISKYNMPCGNCGKNGHNKRTCSYLEEEKADMIDAYVVDECIICYSEVSLGGKGSVKTECGHIYCTKCFVDHMRRSNKCGICRRDVSVPIVKKTLSPDEINTVVLESALTEATFRMIYTDFYTQVQQKLVGQQIINNRDKDLVNSVCTNVLREVQLDYCVWLTGVTVAQRMAIEYER
jgi:hypothetical protein